MDTLMRWAVAAAGRLLLGLVTGPGPGWLAPAVAQEAHAWLLQTAQLVLELLLVLLELRDRERR